MTIGLDEGLVATSDSWWFLWQRNGMSLGRMSLSHDGRDGAGLGVFAGST